MIEFAEKQQMSEYVSQPICSTTECTQSAFKLVNALCTGCSENILTLHRLLTAYFYSGGSLLFRLLTNLLHLQAMTLHSVSGSSFHT